MTTHCFRINNITRLLFCRSYRRSKGLATVTSNGGLRYVPNERHNPEVIDQALCLEGADSEAASGLVRETDSSYKPPYSILKQGVTFCGEQRRLEKSASRRFCDAREDGRPYLLCVTHELLGTSAHPKHYFEGFMVLACFANRAGTVQAGVLACRTRNTPRRGRGAKHNSPLVQGKLLWEPAGSSEGGGAITSI